MAMADALSILHVDDDPEIRLIVDLALRMDPSISVKGVATVAEAHAALADARTPPDALLLDCFVGASTGLDLLHTLQGDARMAHLPAIFLTATLAERDRDRMFAAGAIGVIPKPFNPLSLAREVRGLLGHG
jgi:two-component system, OmpR family, response regulator